MITAEEKERIEKEKERIEKALIRRLEKIVLDGGTMEDIDRYIEAFKQYAEECFHRVPLRS